MRRKDRMIEDSKQIEAILKQGRICRLGLIDGDRALVLPLSYGYQHQTLYFHSAHSGHKIDLLKQTGQVCFEIEEVGGLITAETACDWSVRYRSIIGWGQVRFLSGFDEKVQAMDILMRQHGGEPAAYPPAQIEATTVFALKIDTMTAKGNY